MAQNETSGIGNLQRHRIYERGRTSQPPRGGGNCITQGRRLIDRGRVGSGISTKVLGDLLSLLRPLTEKNGVTWVDPSLQVEVTYFEETEGSHFRFPVFKRIVEASPSVSPVPTA